MARRIAILGCGKIGEALVAGLLSSGWRKKREIVVTARRQERADELHEQHGVEATLANAEAVAGAGLVVVAVKPQDLEALLTEIGSSLTSKQTVLSVAAAMPTATIEAQLADGVPVVRAMPNTPATVHEGIAGICAGDACGRRAPRAGRGMPLPSGRRRPPAREAQDAVTSCLRLRPRVLRAACRGDDRGGHPPRPLSRDLDPAGRGRCNVLLRDEDAPGRAAGGGHVARRPTIRAIHELEQAGVRAAFLNAIQAAMERSRELAQGGQRVPPRWASRRSGSRRRGRSAGTSCARSRQARRWRSVRRAHRGDRRRARR